MKKILLLAVLFCATTSLWAADSSYAPAIGPYLALKGGVNAGSIPNGEKTGFAFNGIPDFGVTGYLPFSKSSIIGASLDLGYTTYAILSAPSTNANDNNTFVAKVSYFTIVPTFDAGALTVGICFGFPMNSTATNNSGSISVSNGTDSLGTIIEIRLGGMIPLVNAQLGRLDLLIQAGYMVTGMSSSSSTSNNPHAASISLGLNYLFALTKD